MTTSDLYKIRDPLRILAHRERMRQAKRALGIARLPEEQWRELVNREPKDDQGEIWAFLDTIKRVRSR